MFTLERRHKILDLIRQHKFIDVHRLSGLLFSSESTIRRDLTILENSGLIQRTFGGAALLEGPNAEIPLSVREDKYNNEKEQIAKLASALLFSGKTVIIDSSSTAFKLIPHVAARKANTVLTNSPKVAIELAKYPDMQVFSTGGYLRENSLSYVGRIARQAVSMFHLDTMFFSCVGISLSDGLTDTSEEEADLKNVMMDHSKTRVALIDSSKFGLTTFSKICGFDKINYLITDKDPGTEWKTTLAAADVALLFPKI